MPVPHRRSGSEMTSPTSGYPTAVKPLEIVRLHRSDDVAERPGEWRCGLARARELMANASAAEAIDRLAQLSAEIDRPNPHGAPDLKGVTFAFRQAEDGRQRFAGVLVRTPAGYCGIPLWKTACRAQRSCGSCPHP